MDPPGVFFGASITVWSKQFFEEGKYCAFEVCKYRNCWSKNLSFYKKQKSKENLSTIKFLLATY